MNIKKISVFFLSAMMIFMMTSCSKSETYDFGDAKTLSDVREHMEQGKKLTQDFYFTIKETNKNFETYTEFYRTNGKEVRRLSYDTYQTRFIRTENEYVVIDDMKQTAAIYPPENVHDDIMWSDMDFIISVIDMALSGEIVNSAENSESSFTEVYKIESGDSLIFDFQEGKLNVITLLDKSDDPIAVYELNYGNKGGKNSLFKYKGYQITDMKVYGERSSEITQYTQNTED